VGIAEWLMKNVFFVLKDGCVSGLYGKFLSRISAIKNATGFFRELMVT
jgi:hypothetical protein